jgi:hypothetical protein
MTANRKFTISGPGAADFLASPGGEDLPGTSTSKGTSQTRDESLTSDARNFEPAFDADQDDTAARGPKSAADERTGSQTGTIGGGGADAHNPDPVRATGVDDPTAAGPKRSKKKTTKKY